MSAKKSAPKKPAAKKPAAKAKKVTAKKPAAKKPAAKATVKKPAAKKPVARGNVADVEATLREVLGSASFRALRSLGNALVDTANGKLSLDEEKAKAVAAALFPKQDAAEAFVTLLGQAVKETEKRANASTTPTPLA